MRQSVCSSASCRLSIMVRLFNVVRLKSLMDSTLLLATLFLLNRAFFESPAFSDDVASVGDHRHRSRVKRASTNEISQQADASEVQSSTNPPTTDKAPTADEVAEETARVAWLSTQDERKQLVADGCKHDALTLQKALNRSSRSGYDFLDLALVDDKHKVIYCAAPKVATTNWKRVFLVLTGKAQADMKDLEKKNPHDKRNFKTLAHYSMEQRLRLVKEYRKFLFVRHPFKRIVSAFYDRLHYDARIQDNFKRLVGTYIIRKYRSKDDLTPESLQQGHDVKFPELVQFLTDTTNPQRLVNGHFAPITNLCFPCQVDYDYIGKYETLLEDARMILAQFNVSLPFIFPPTTNKNSKTSDRWLTNMRLLNEAQYQALYREYKRDFDLFQYDPLDWKSV